MELRVPGRHALARLRRTFAMMVVEGVTCAPMRAIAQTMKAIVLAKGRGVRGEARAGGGYDLGASFTRDLAYGNTAVGKGAGGPE